MRNSFKLAILGGLLTVAAVSAVAQSDAWLENPSYNLPGTGGGNGIAYGNSYSVGANFQFTGANVAAGSNVEITALGYYAGTTGEFPNGSGGSVTANQTVALFGGNTTTHGGNLSGNLLAEVTVATGTAIDADGFAWVNLTTPVMLTYGDYYDLLSTESGSEAYLNPYDGGSPNNSALANNSSGVIAGTPFYVNSGAYASSISASEGYAYTWSAYLGPNMQYEVVVPEPSTLALLAGGGLMTLFGFRRRRC
ncbi:MAG: PEP-CTERM sorting domain-containing protein [Limisphaerales bacterium]